MDTDDSLEEVLAKDTTSFGLIAPKRANQVIFELVDLLMQDKIYHIECFKTFLGLGFSSKYVASIGEFDGSTRIYNRHTGEFSDHDVSANSLAELMKMSDYWEINRDCPGRTLPKTVAEITLGKEIRLETRDQKIIDLAYPLFCDKFGCLSYFENMHGDHGKIRMNMSYSRGYCSRASRFASSLARDSAMALIGMFR